jgi:hypothetical protein
MAEAGVLFHRGGQKNARTGCGQVTFDAVDSVWSVWHGPGMEDRSGIRLSATMGATFDIIGGNAIRHVASGQAQAYLLDKIRMGQINITRRTQLFCQTIDQLGRFHSAVGGVTDAGRRH